MIEDDKDIDKYIELYVRNTYLKILKRDVEPECKKACVQAIKQGDIQKDQLSSILRNSKEYKNRFQKDIEIIGIVTCGTYPSWIDYTIASFYNHVDKIVVVNGGYDIAHPERGAIFPLEREHKLIKEIDINNKIIEINPTQEMLDNVYKIGNESDCAAHVTLATQTAHNLPNHTDKKRYILKLDSDQIMTQIIRKQMTHTIKTQLHFSKIGIIALQRSDNYHDLEHVGHDIVLGNGALLYESLPNQSYDRKGMPIFRNKLIFNNMFETAHMKRISPKDIEPLVYHYKRAWCRIYEENLATYIKTGKKFTNEEIKEIAYRDAVTFLEYKGRHMRSLPYDDRMLYHPPVIFKTNPLNYIKIGY